MRELLSYSGVGVTYRGRPPVPALRDVDLVVGAGEVVGVAGETGCGKTTLAHLALGLVTAEVTGAVRVAGVPVDVTDERSMRTIRGTRIALAPQQAMRSLDPVHRVGRQIVEAARADGSLSRRVAQDRTRALWERLGMPSELYDEYPHRLSGGQARRALLAMAFVTEPDVVVLDEPTSGLDTADRRRLAELLEEHRARGGAALVISHDLADLRQLADRLVVLYAGRMAEAGPARDVLAEPRHPYSWSLIRSYPWMDRESELMAVRGAPPEPGRAPGGCAFHPRCSQAVEECRTRLPPPVVVGDRTVACHLGGVLPVLEADGLTRTYGNGRGLRVPTSFRVLHGEVVAVLGPTGSGKSTLALTAAGVLRPDAGTVRLHGREIDAAPGAAARAGLQLVFQDPHASISPRERIRDVVSEPLVLLKDSARASGEAVTRVLAEVGLPTSEDFLARPAHTLSGGQLQRLALARALTTDPTVLIADEPTAMLDASEQARLIRLLADLQNQRGMAVLVVSHDLGLIRKFADRVLVLDSGRLVEEGPTGRIMRHPTSDVTRRLIRLAHRSNERTPS